VQDIDNLVWKLDLVLRGLAPERVLDSYDAERVPAADENLLNTTRSTDFIAPKSAMSRMFRDGVLALAETEPFARRLVNSGRLSIAACYDRSPLNTADGFAAGDTPAARPGAAAPDAPLGDAWFLGQLAEGFACVRFDRNGGMPGEALRAEPGGRLPVTPLVVSEEAACARYGALDRPAWYLFRPDGHVAARWRQPPPGAIDAALARATADTV
jgi:3-(3-hydroxy-phenyl)propionate hydroxylase